MDEELWENLCETLIPIVAGANPEDTKALRKALEALPDIAYREQELTLFSALEEALSKS